MNNNETVTVSKETYNDFLRATFMATMLKGALENISFIVPFNSEKDRKDFEAHTAEKLAKYEGWADEHVSKFGK
jgi:hypothetical protein